MIGRNEELFEQVYNITKLHAKVGVFPGITKIIFFFAIETLLIVQPLLIRQSARIAEALFYFNSAYTLLVVVLGIGMLLGKSVKLKSIFSLNMGLLLYPLDYVMLPLKLCSFIAYLRGSTAYLALSLADLLFALLLSQIQAAMLRDLNPSDKNFLSMMDSSVENWTLLLSPLKVLVLAVLADFSSDRSQQDAVMATFRVALNPVIGGFLVGIALLRRPFCQPLAEKVFTLCLLLSNLFCSLFEIMDSLTAAIKIAVFLLPASALVLLGLLEKGRFGQLSVSKENPPLQAIKDLLAQGADSTAKIHRQGQYRALLIENKQFKELLERMTSVLRQLAGPDLSSPGGLADMIMMRLPTIGNMVTPKSPMALANQRLLHGIVDHPFRPAIFGKKEDEEVVAEVKEEKKPAINLNPNLGMTAEEAMMLQISDEEIESHIIDLYLSNNKHSYHVFLRLMWMLKRRPSLLLVFTALGDLRHFNAKFRSNYLLYFAKREVEKFLLDFDIGGKKQGFLKGTKPVQHEKRTLTQQQSLKKGSVTVGTSQFQGGIGTGGVSELAQNANIKVSKKEFKYQMSRAAEEYVDLANVFHYKSSLKSLVHNIKEFSKLNREYVELITLPQQDLYHRTQLTQKLFDLDQKVRTEYEQIAGVAGDYDFQHLIPYFYHLHFNTNRHNDSERQFSEVAQKVASAQGLRQRNIKQPLNSNLINETVCLLIESQVSRFGTILDVYGKIDMLVDPSESIVGENYQIFLNDALKVYHDQVAVAMYETSLLGHHGEQLSKVKTGMVKIPFRNLLIPSHVLLKICPFAETGFKYMISIKPDFTDTRLFFSVDRLLQVDGYSSTLLNVVDEKYLASKVPLEMMMNTTYQNIVQLKQGYEHTLQVVNEPQVKSKAPKSKDNEKPPMAARARAGSTRTTNLQNLMATVGRPIENRSQTYGIEDGRSVRSRSLINSALPSGITHNLLAPTEMSKDFVHEEKVRFFAELQENNVPLSVRQLQMAATKESSKARRKSVAVITPPKATAIDKPFNDNDFVERSLKITAKYHCFMSDYAKIVGAPGHWVMYFHQHNNLFGTGSPSDVQHELGGDYSLSGNPGGHGFIHSNTPSGQKTADRDKNQAAGNSLLHNSPVNPNNSDSRFWLTKWVPASRVQ